MNYNTFKEDGKTYIKKRQVFKLGEDYTYWPLNIAHQIVKNTHYNIFNIINDMEFSQFQINIIEDNFEKYYNEITELNIEIKSIVKNNWNIKVASINNNIFDIYNKIKLLEKDKINTNEIFYNKALLIKLVYDLKKLIKLNNTYDNTWIEDEINEVSIQQDKIIFKNSKYKIFIENGILKLIDSSTKDKSYYYECPVIFDYNVNRFTLALKTNLPIIIKENNQLLEG